MTRHVTIAALLLAAPVALLQAGCSFDGQCINCALDDAGLDASETPSADADTAIDGGPRPDACVPSGIEVCDGLDNDCNGEVDDEVADVGNPCGVDTGECVAGTLDCIDGEMECTNGFVGPVPETCDGKDNDCDGADDNGDPGGGVVCGTDVGECHSGLTACIDGGIECTGMLIGPEDEVCDGKDNDCDGMFDEGTPVSPAACGTTDVGLCELGLEQCIGGVIQCIGKVDPVLDVCDGMDNDCDGTADEDFDLDNDPFNCGSCGFVCGAPEAFSICSGGMCEILACDPGFHDIDGDYDNGCEYECNFQGAEVCGDPDGDGNPDEDCDGLVDEGIVAPDICDQDGACAGTVPTCMTSGWVCVYAPPVETDGTGAITPETLCDGEDNDCDGLVDEPFPTLGVACDDGGLGICKGTGTVQCTSPTTASCVITTPGLPAATETCNGLDDDCDGTADDGDLNEWVAFDAGGATAYMWKYEASRPDADASSAGVISARACSKPDAIPWTNLTHPQAEQLCTDLGLRLCSEGEWQAACEAPVASSPFQQDTGPQHLVIFEAEAFDGIASGTTDDWIVDTSQPGFRGTSGMLASPNDGNNYNTTYVADSPRLDYDVNFVTTGTHYIWIRGYAEAPTGSNDSVHAGLDGSGFASADRITGWGQAWSWSNDTMDGAPATFNVTSTGVHTVNIWMREDGTRIDAVIITTDPSFTPTGSGPTPGCEWSYNAACNTYQPTKCNGNDYDCIPGAPDDDCLLPTGDRALCYANWGGAGHIHDLSGNVKEWTAERSAGVNPLRGGSYNNTATGISCGFDFTVADDTFLFPNVGFRCCSDTLP